MPEDEETTTGLLDTRVDEMTVGDSLKLQVYILAGMAGIVGAVAAVGATRERIRRWKIERAVRKDLAASDLEIVTDPDDE
jgi:hypothetical protein